MKIKHLDRYKKSSIESYRRWHTYDRNIWLKIFRTEDWIRELLSEITRLEDSAILEVGCGTGRMLEALVPFKPRRLCGLDISANMIRLAAEKLARSGYPAELKNADAETEIPWPEGTFDYVFFAGAFHHLFQPLAALAQVRQALKPNGKVIVVDGFSSFWMRWPLNLILRIAPLRGDCRFYSDKEIMKLLDEAGYGELRSKRIRSWSLVVSGCKGK